jgi:hypothetical protein
MLFAREGDVRVKIALATVAALLSSTAFAQSAPSVWTAGAPPVAASMQTFHESANSYYAPAAPGTVDTIGGGYSAEAKAKFAKFRAAKAAKAQRQAG